MKQCKLCGTQFKPSHHLQKYCDEHNNTKYYSCKCKHCGKEFIHQHKREFCEEPKLCASLYNFKSDGSITIIGANAPNGKKARVFIIMCNKCGNIFPGTKNPTRPNGLNNQCSCVSSESYNKHQEKLGNGNAAWRILRDVPRIGNLKKLKKFDSVEKDESYGVKACLNCGNFEKIRCPLQDSDLWKESFNMDTHICESFVWYLQ